MKKQLLVFAAVLFSLSLAAQVTTGTLSDFEDGTTQGWSNGASSPNPPTNIPTGGPGGADDNFLEEISSGGGGAGSKMVIQNDNPEWTGNYTEANVTNINYDIKNAGVTDLAIRIGISGGADSSEMVTTNSVPVPVSTTDWIQVSMLITAGQFTVVDGTDTPEEILQDIDEIRILSNTNLSYSGEAIDGVMHIDNIRQLILLGVDELTEQNVKLYPNPVTDLLNVSTQERLVDYEIYNVLGSLVKKAPIGDTSASIDVSTLKSGMYMIRLNAENSSLTKRFVVSN